MSQQQPEIWKYIKETEERYQVSNYGRIRYVDKWVRIRKLSVNIQGYYIIVLKNRDTQKTFKIHQLVWDYFGNAPRNGYILQIDHVDNNKLNNHIDNLQLLSGEENKAKGWADSKKSDLPVGVTFVTGYGKKYQANIRCKRKSYYLGSFGCITAASLAYQVAFSQIKRGCFNGRRFT